MKGQLAAVGIPRKIVPEHLATIESSAVVQYALEQAFRTFVGWDTRIGIEARKLRITVKEPELDYLLQPSGPEVVSQEQEARFQARARASKLSSTADKVVGAVFVEPPAVVVILEELSDYDALQSLRAADGKDLLAALAATPLDYAAVWRTVMQSVTKYPLVVQNELPRASDASRYTLWTKPVGSNDANWIYQKFYEVSLLDPMSRNPLRKGRELRVVVELVVGFSKRKTNFRYFKQSTKESEDLADHILAAIKRP